MKFTYTTTTKSTNDISKLVALSNLETTIVAQKRCISFTRPNGKLS